MDSPLGQLWEGNNIISACQDNSAHSAYQIWQNRFMLNRLRLATKIDLLVGVTITTFFIGEQLWQQGELRFTSLVIGGIVELGVFCCWISCQTSWGKRDPGRIFLALCWSVNVIVQIGLAFVNEMEPQSHLWTLVFLTQATLIPVRWPLHLISQLGTVVGYGILYSLVDLNLKYSFFYYAERGLYLFWACVICNFSVCLYERLQKTEFQTRRELEAAQEKSERLLLNILPGSIAERLKSQNIIIADSFDEVTVLFADIVGFTEISTKISPIELVELLNQLFSMFDQLAEKHKLEKIKTIGDAYLVVAGLPIPCPNHAIAIAEMGLDMQEAVKSFNSLTGQSLRLRIGISTGPVVAGVIGLKKFAYDLWGDTVNTASRMESHGLAGQIQVSESTYMYLQEKYLFVKRGIIQIKGKGEMTTYLLTGKRN